VRAKATRGPSPPEPSTQGSKLSRPTTTGPVETQNRHIGRNQIMCSSVRHQVVYSALPLRPVHEVVPLSLHEEGRELLAQPGRQARSAGAVDLGMCTVSPATDPLMAVAAKTQALEIPLVHAACEKGGTPPPP